MNRLLTPRRVYGAIFFACVALMGFALYLQHAQALEPCPMCILQRYAVIAIGVVALIAMLHAPRGWGLGVYCVLVALLAIAGGGVALRHSWLQHFPNPSQTCGADLGYLLELPFSRAWPAIFRGTGECSAVQWSFLGLSIPEWALVWFAVFLLVVVWTFFVWRRKE